MNAWLYGLFTNHQREDLSFYCTDADSILELGCGIGRVLLPCAQKGAICTGIDYSPEFIATCQRAFEEAQLPVALHLEDMTHFELEHRFAQIQIPLRTFQLLQPEYRLRCLQHCQKHLRPNGQLILHVSHTIHEQPSRPWTVVGTRESTDGGWFLLEEAVFAQANHTTLLHKASHLLIDASENQVWTMRHRLYHLSQADLMDLLQEAGFQSPHIQPFRQDIIVTARRT